jgi:hypothetical protein
MSVAEQYEADLKPGERAQRRCSRSLLSSTGKSGKTGKTEK